jgi:asparagine synthase (glutamine-hydrolysing)
MCGIAGVYSLTDHPPDPEWGRLLTRALRHRGPDGDGVYSDSRIVLAHTRLAIIDLTEGGRQPMPSADGRYVVVSNGEIYNHAELRERLKGEGITFRTRSDTEVLVEALARHGAGAIPSLWGMFAFAWYDRRSGKLLLARDRVGKKPLLYHASPEWVAFASEASALLRLPFVKSRLDLRSLSAYARFLYVPGPRTLLDGVRKVPPGSVLEVQPSGLLEPVPYWRMPETGNGSGTDAPAAEQLERDLDALILDATRLRTVSDVPIGVFLSGGIDSNTILEALRRIGHRPIRAFTVGFRGLPDERALARMGASRFADSHTEIEVRSEIAEEVPRILRHFGEPLGDSAIVTTYWIAREASRHVKVILNGDGGDELFGGYARYPFARRLDLAASLPGGLELSRRLYAGRGYLDGLFESLSKRRFATAAETLSSVLTPPQEEALFAASRLENGLDRRADRGARVPALASGPSTLTAAVFDWDSRAYLPDDLLTKVDLASMAHGLENRSPFLDHRLFEALAPVPLSLRAHPFQTKPLLRKLVRRRLPKALLRAPKRGFQLPLDSWLRGELKGWLTGTLGDPQATGRLYREGAIRKELERFHADHSDPHAPYRLWGLAVLELWAREFQVEVPS